MKLRIEYTALDELNRYPRNPKNHAIDEIGRSMGRHGFTDPILIDERTGFIAHGHGRLDALVARQQAGEPVPEGIELREGKWFVPVVRGWSSKNDGDARDYVIGHNQTTILGGWNETTLGELAREMLATKSTLEGVGFDSDELLKIATRATETKPVEEEKKKNRDKTSSTADYDAIEPVTRRGDLWALGDHRLICADSLRRETLEALLGTKKAGAVVTDPPYAIFGSSTGIGPDIADDKMVRPFFEDVFRQIHRVLSVNCHAYVFTDWRSWSAMWGAARFCEMTAKNMIVWDKGDQGQGSAYLQCHELCGYFAKMPPPKSVAEWGNQRVIYKSNIFRFPRVLGDERIHNAQKPLGFCVELIQNSTDEGDIVVDLFGGSGTTLIAAEKTKRLGYLCEIEPRECDKIIRRWEAETGKKATLIRNVAAEETETKGKRRARTKRD
jgi:DNA modification methylase